MFKYKKDTLFNSFSNTDNVISQKALDRVDVDTLFTIIYFETATLLIVLIKYLPAQTVEDQVLRKTCIYVRLRKNCTKITIKYRSFTRFRRFVIYLSSY